jgi:hypothetical protein
MTRTLVAACAFALVGAATAHAAPPIARPNTALVGVHVDYVSPLPGAATIAPLRQAVIAQALADERHLSYLRRDDLGGFVPAPLGELALSSGGRTLVGAAGAQEIPQYAQAAGGAVTSFAAVGGAPPARPPENGTQPVPGLGTPGPFLPPANANGTPPPNQGFGGTPKPPVTPPATTTTAPTPTPPTTTALPVTTPTPTVTTPPTTTASQPLPAPPPATTTIATVPTPTPNASCGTTGLTITSDHSTCEIHAVNMGPGGSVAEVLTVRNDSGGPFTLSLRAAGAQSSLWNDLRLGVWEDGTAPPTPFPPLLWWTTQPNTLTILDADATIRYRVELLLPPSAGNADQGKQASIDLVWTAQG